MMKNLLLLLALAVAAPLYLAGQTKTRGAKPQQSASTKPELPPDAEKVRDGVWRHKDKDGKVWIYTKTPFGLARGPEEAEAAPAAAKATGLRLVSSKDEAYTFERPTPFGVARWTHKVEELTDDEKQLVEKAKPAPADSAPKSESGAKE